MFNLLIKYLQFQTLPGLRLLFSMLQYTLHLTHLANTHLMQHITATVHIRLCEVQS
jgi:hypothetical protein